MRVVLEPKPDLPTDPNDPGAFIDVFTDVSGLFVINNESGWYEGWMIHDNDPSLVGDNPNNPRDPDRALNTSPEDPDRGMVQNDDHKEKRTRFIPSGLAEEILIDVYMRLASFEPDVKDTKQRLLDAYAKEVARVDQNGDGILSFVEVDSKTTQTEVNRMIGCTFLRLGSIASR